MGAISLSLRAITKGNYEAVCDLDVSEQQQDYVACNMWSLVEAQFNSGYSTRAIYLSEQPIGFFMWVQESAHKVSIWRFMIDERYQRQGYGRYALTLAIAEIKEQPQITEIEICYNPSNPVAKQFYSQFGFIEQGMDDDEEDMLALLYIENQTPWH